MDRQCPSCGGFCKKSGCERENIAPPQREQVVYCGCGDGIVPDDGAECGTCVSMRQREWQGLTDDEIDAIWREHLHRDSLVRAIEAKLREKNFG